MPPADQKTTKSGQKRHFGGLGWPTKPDGHLWMAVKAVQRRCNSLICPAGGMGAAPSVTTPLAALQAGFGGLGGGRGNIPLPCRVSEGGYLCHLGCPAPPPAIHCLQTGQVLDGRMTRLPDGDREADRSQPMATSVRRSRHLPSGESTGSYRKDIGGSSGFVGSDGRESMLLPKIFHDQIKLVSNRCKVLHGQYKHPCDQRQAVLMTNIRSQHSHHSQ